MFIPDLSPYHPSEPTVKAVGWLDPIQDYTKGVFPPELLEILRSIKPSRQTRGFHRCPYCENNATAATSSNEIRIDGDGCTYAAPHMIIHYIEDHGYCPPQEFIDAVNKHANNQHTSTNDSETVYEELIKHINDGTATAEHFNELIEAIDKSTKERVYRRTRRNNPEPMQTSMLGRIVPKKSGHNDPPRQGRGRRYASGTPAKEQQNARQRRRFSARVGDSIGLDDRISEALATLLHNNGSDPTRIITTVDADKIGGIRAVASALLRAPEVLAVIGEQINSDWLYNIICAADNRLLVDGKQPENITPLRLVLSKKQQNVSESGQGTLTASNQASSSHAPFCVSRGPFRAFSGDLPGGDLPGVITVKQHDGSMLVEKKEKEKKKEQSNNDRETRSYEVTGKPEQLDNLEKLLKWVEYCGNVGHTGTAELSVDGDGNAKLKFSGLSVELPEETGQYNPEVRIGIS